MRWVRAAMVACTAVLLAAARAEAGVVVAWNLNGIDPAQVTVIDANAGSGSLDFSGLGTTAGVLQGTTLGALQGDVAGESLVAIGTLANQTSFRFDFDATGWEGLVLTFATRRSATGASMNRVECWNGLAWESVASFTSNAATWELVTVKLAAIDASNGGYASVRFVLDGATGSSGSLRFDNIAVSGTATPAPGAVALLAAAGLASRRQRR
jgi:MYXO-CTERM domain-containing protein